MQTKSSSVVETIVSTFVGFWISFAIQQWIINPLWNLNVTITDNLGIITIFTVASLLRGYVLRRVFNTQVVKQFKKELDK